MCVFECAFNKLVEMHHIVRIRHTTDRSSGGNINSHLDTLPYHLCDSNKKRRSSSMVRKCLSYDKSIELVGCSIVVIMFACCFWSLRKGKGVEWQLHTSRFFLSLRRLIIYVDKTSTVRTTGISENDERVPIDCEVRVNVFVCCCCIIIHL